MSILRNFVIVGLIGLLIHQCCYGDEHVYGEAKSGIQNVLSQNPY